MTDPVGWLAKLAHPGLVAQLRPVIVLRSLKAATRRVALNIAERCGLKELQPEILNVVLDGSDNHAVRAMAVAALRRCGDASALSQLLALARDEAGDDPQDEIKGYALDLLWPTHISTADVFALLTPSDPSFFGGYANFMFGLPTRLATPDLLPALPGRARRRVRSRSGRRHMGHRRTGRGRSERDADVGPDPGGDRHSPPERAARRRP
jgi:hypothetical protein